MLNLSENIVKMTLKIELFKDNSVGIKLLSVNKKYIQDPIKKNYNFYTDNKTGFVIWSTEEFMFNDRQFRLPDSMNINDNMYYKYQYKSENERKKYMKLLYNTLLGWSNRMNKEFNIKPKYSQIILTGNYWYIM